MSAVTETLVTATSMPHPVLSVLADRLRAGSEPGRRTDGLRVALAIEGGGMRGTVSAGMALELTRLGLLPAFDAVYGSSAGAISAAWLLSSNPEGLAGWAEPIYAKTLIRGSNPLRGRPIVDVEKLVEHVYRRIAVLDFDSVLANPITVHPLATDSETGQSVDLRPRLTDAASLRLAMRASSALPVLAGPAISLAGGRYYDAGLAESVPYRTAIAQGATHVLVLRSKVAPAVAPVLDAPAGIGRPARGARIVARTAMRGESARLLATYLGRAARLVEDDAVLARHHADCSLAPAIYSLRPAAALRRREVGKLSKNGALLAEALERGQAAVRLALGAARSADVSG